MPPTNIADANASVKNAFFMTLLLCLLRVRCESPLAAGSLAPAYYKPSAPGEPPATAPDC